jgi:cysteine desulfurase
MPQVYFDYASTTPIDLKVLGEMRPYLKKEFGNPSSVHSCGQRVAKALQEARKTIAEFLNCQPAEVFFTGSATEADNLAVLGLIRAFESKKKPHIIISAIEHHAILEPCRFLEKEGVELSILPVDKNGIILLSELKKLIKSNTLLVSVIYANNEIGTIQPIAQISKIIKEKEQELKTKIYFHTDAVQAANYLDCSVKNLAVDMLTLSAHKIYGPKGVGSLYIKKGTPIQPLIFGGGQEQGLRSGTENIAGIVGMAAAIKEAGSPKAKIYTVKVRQLRDKLIREIPRIIPAVELNGSLEKRLPNNVNFSFAGIEGEALLIALDQKGFAVSTGSACSSHNLESSHVLLALGIPEERTHSSLRITLGKDTAAKEIEKFLKVLPKVVERLREISGYKIK